jgi:exopolyphosphatase
VLTSFTGKSGKHKRELLLVTKTGHAFKSVGEAQKVMEGLVAGFEAADELRLVEWESEIKRFLGKRKTFANEKEGRFGKVWKQENKKATRKQVAPLLREIVAKLQ